jgi:hypothetical protein
MGHSLASWRMTEASRIDAWATSRGNVTIEKLHHCEDELTHVAPYLSLYPAMSSTPFIHPDRFRAARGVALPAFHQPRAAAYLTLSFVL